MLITGIYVEKFWTLRYDSFQENRLLYIWWLNLTLPQLVLLNSLLARNFLPARS